MDRIDVSRFEKITLQEMSSVKMMRRIDLKYVVTLEHLQNILQHLEADYFAQEINEKCICDYSTLYFDTPDYQMYIAHQNGKLNRLKIRTRKYIDSDLCFLEIKTKSNKGVTQKIRIENASTADIDNTNCESFLCKNTPYGIHSIEGKVWSIYKRITLVNKQKTERMTIDIDLSFRNEHSHTVVELPQIAIIEVKKTPGSPSLTLNKLNELRIKQTKMSKYCMGVGLTEQNVKKNRLKAKFAMLNKITPINYVPIS